MDLPSFDPPQRLRHRKKSRYEYVHGNWTEDDLMHCVERRHREHIPYRQIIRNTNISLSTLFTKVKSLAHGGVAKPDRGPRRKLSKEQEQELADFIKECWVLRVPKTRINFACDIVNYLRCYRLTNNFPNIWPGKGWFTRFEAENPSVKFTTPSKLKEKLNEEITLQNWIKERDQYIHEQELGTKCWSRHAVFLAEVEELDTHPRSQVAFKTIILYNAAAVYCQPLVIHDGTILQSVLEEYAEKLDFIQTDNGMLTFNCLGRCVEYVNNYLQIWNVDYPGLLYFSPDFAESLSFTAWKFAKQNNIIVQIIPRSVWKNMTSEHLGIFRKFHSKFKRMAYQKVFKRNMRMTCALYLECIYQCIKSGPFQAHLRSGFSRLHLVALESLNELRRLAAEEELRQQQIQSFIEHTRANSVLHAMFDRFGSDG